MISKPREWIYVEYSFPWDLEIHEKSYVNLEFIRNVIEVDY
jgi:hypothetical protein